MRLTIDLNDGNGPVDYTAALVMPAPEQSGAASLTALKQFSIERRRGEYTRCSGTLNAAALGLRTPAPGARLLVRSNAGATIFAGYVSAATQAVANLLHEGAPARFAAIEDAALLNTAIDTSLQPATATAHPVTFESNRIRFEAGASVDDRFSDVTITGAEEPVTYVTELFQGDGTTATFALADPPFKPAGIASLVDDSFAASGFRSQVWSFVDTGQHLGLGSGGLRLAGGNGFDGQTLMRFRNRVELGGTLCAEMRGVALQPGSEGVLLGMYGNVVTRLNCFAGVHVKATGGAQSLTALVNGAEVGTALNWSTGHSYTLRVRLHCAETQRVMATYRALVNGVLQAWGGGVVDAPMQIVIEVVDEGLASSTPATVLYSGAVASSLAQAVFAPVNSVSLIGSVAHIALQQQGSAWVTVTQPDGTVVAQRPGSLDTGVDYRMSGSSLQFFPGRVPVANALICVRYRRGQRSRARMQNAADVAAEQAQGLPGLRQASRAVSEPVPRSAADCAAAAQALLAFQSSPAHAVQGHCVLPNAVATGDIGPGDTIALPLARTPVQVPVERVTITTAHTLPEILEYSVAFEQTERNGLSFRVSESVPGDAALPGAPFNAATTAALPALAVTIAGGTALQLDAGTTAPVGGGFEVRRHDGGWGADIAGAPPDSDLVLRSPVRSFSIPRSVFAERFFVRMYDGSQTPVYSAQSSLVITHLPIG